MQIYIIVLNAAAAILLFAVAPRLGKAAWRAPRGPFRVVSTGCAIMCLLLAMSSVHLLLIQAARGSGHARRRGRDLGCGAGRPALEPPGARPVDGPRPDGPDAVKGPRQAGQALHQGTRGPWFDPQRSPVRRRDSRGSSHLPGHGRNTCAAHPPEDWAPQPPRPHAAPAREVGGIERRYTGAGLAASGPAGCAPRRCAVRAVP